MSYKELGEVEIVVLGGINKLNGKKNPTELEGYFLNVEDKPNRFNKHVPQKFYTFQTKDGDKGIYGKAGIDKGMRAATLGAMTKIVDTGELLDTGKGNPMRVFKVYQDKNNTIDVANLDSGTPLAASAAYEETGDAYGETAVDAEDENLFDDAPPARAVAPSAPATTVNAAAQARVAALLNKNRPRTI